MKVGIVGLPNAGKSSLFSALTGVAAEAANYPFTTIEPNIAIVPVADDRLDAVAATVRASKVVPDTIAFHDIAGLVAGAHRGEGLGNQFLGNIRETDALVHVVRTHTDQNVVHPDGRVDPLADVETIETELIYADLEQTERRLERVAKTAKSGDRRAMAEADWLRDMVTALQSGRPARTVPVSPDVPDAMALLQPLTAKPVLFVANVDEGSDEVPPAIVEHARAQGALAVAVSARLEAELAELPEEEAVAMRADLGLSESGLRTVVRGAFSLLELVAFFTAGEDKPAQSWHLRRGLSVWHAAGMIHSDIQRGFVRAEVVHWDELVDARGLRRSPRARNAATRRARLRRARRRRDHGPLHPLASAGPARGCRVARDQRKPHLRPGEWDKSRPTFRLTGGSYLRARWATHILSTPRIQVASDDFVRPGAQHARSPERVPIGRAAPGGPERVPNPSQTAGRPPRNPKPEPNRQATATKSQTRAKPPGTATKSQTRAKPPGDRHEIPNPSQTAGRPARDPKPRSAERIWEIARAGHARLHESP